MEYAEFITMKYGPMKEIIRSNIGGGGHMVVQVRIIVNSKGPNIIVNN